MRPKEILVVGQSEEVIGSLLHSMPIDGVLEWLLSHSQLPFLAFYNETCGQGLDAERYDDLMDSSSVNLRRLALDANCLAECRLLISQGDATRLPESPLMTERLLPKLLTKPAFAEMLGTSLKEQLAPNPNCKWLFNTNLEPVKKLIKKGMPNFWQFFHPSCYIRHPWEPNYPHYHNQWAQTKTFLFDAYHYVTGLTELPDFARWVVQVCLVALNTKMYFYGERTVIADMELKLGIIANQVIGHPLNESLYAFQKEYLGQIGCLLDETIRRISLRPRNIPQKIKPCFNSILGLVQANRFPGDLKEATRLHWETMTAFLFEELFGMKQVEGFFDLLEGDRRLWAADMTMIFAPFMQMNTLDMLPMREVLMEQLKHDRQLQRTVLRWLHRTYSAQHPALEMQVHLKVMVMRIPHATRIKYVRELALSYYSGYKVTKALKKYKKAFPDHQDHDRVNAAVSQFFTAALDAKGIIDGHLVFDSPFWSEAALRLLGFFLAISVLYGQPAKVLKWEQLSVLLSYTKVDGPPGDAELKVNRFVSVVSSAFNELLGFPALLTEDEVARELLDI